jgi:hypothetical protein
MSLIINGTERDEFIIGKSIFKYAGEWIDTKNSQLHNATYRGQDLGPFNETFANDINNSTFNNMWVGDTFTQNGHTYKIGGFNYLYGADDNVHLPSHLLMITDILTSRAMNPTATTSGGFAGSDMWKSYFPTVVKQLKADFGDHLLTWNEYLTTGVDGNAADHAANQGAFFPVQASMMNSFMYSGTALYSNKYDAGIETKQLPIMQLHPDEQKGGTNWTWLRDIYDSNIFVTVEDSGAENADQTADNSNIGVRAFFLID